jgi:hypothetical protein
MQIITTLAGASFRPAEAKDILRGLSVGDFLDLEAEPDNRFDSNAVKLLYAGEHLGYVAKINNPEVAEALAEGQALSARVIDFETSLKPVLMIEENTALGNLPDGAEFGSNWGDE